MTSKSNLMCKYHDYEESVYTCETCNAPFCEECHEIEKKKKGPRNSKEIVRYHLCKPCFFEKELSKIKSSSAHILRKILKFVVYPFLIFSTLIFTLMMMKMYEFTEPYIWSSLAFFGVMVFIETIFVAVALKTTQLNTPKKMKRINIKKARFFSNALALSKIYTTEDRILLLSYCPSCNARIEPEMLLCSTCGIELNIETT